MFLMIPCRIGVFELFIKKDVEKASTKEFVMVTTALNILIIICGLVIKNLGMVFKINGSVVATLIALILPCLF